MADVISGEITVATSESAAYVRTNARIDNIISAVTTDTEVTDIRVGADGVTYQTAATAVNTQFTNLTDEVNRYKNGERNAILTEGATANEKAVFDNLLYIKAYGIDLSGYYISTIVNTPETPYRMILKKDNDSAHNIFIDNTDGTDNYCCYKAENKFIVVGYRWSAHSNDVNLNYNNSHIKILDSVHSTDSIISFLDSKISTTGSQVNALYEEIERYSNGERNAILTEGATANEKAVFDNLLYIKAYGIDLSGYYVSTVINSEQYPYRIIFKKSADNSQAIIIDNPDGSDNYCYYKTTDSFIVIGYQWNNHANDINLSFENSHIKILDTVHSTDSIISFLDSKISTTGSSIISMGSEIRDIQDAMFEDAITGIGTVTSVIEQSYLAGNPTSTYIQPISNPVFKCTVYQVSSGSTYRFIANNYSLGGSFPSVVFTTTEINAAGTLLANSDVLYSADTSARNVDFIYNCTQNGYIVIAWMSNKTELKMYETEKVRIVDELNDRVQFIESKTNDLSNKTIAVLGDSIMMLQRTNYSGTNTVSYLGSDGITYTFDQLTNIDGKLYVTADNSISCTVVNSNQNKLDNQNWDALKAKTGAADIINCGLGGATVKEKQIITEYPYPDGDGKTGSLSNEVKMLKRLVQNGRSAPDCIMIWIGTNDSTGTLNIGNYDEIMALDYTTLADDTLGRSYRRTFYGGLRYSLETLCREYPFATIFVFTPIQTNPSNTRTYENLSATGEALMKMANRYSCICVNALTEIGIVDLLEASDGSGPFLYDGLHPNANGKKLFANFTAKKLNQLYFSKN